MKGNRSRYHPFGPDGSCTVPWPGLVSVDMHLVGMDIVVMGGLQQ